MTVMKRSLLLPLFLLFALLPGLARSEEEERKPGPLVVYGDDLMFTVKEPVGWIGDVEKAKHVQAAVVLYPEQETFEEKSAVIAVQVSGKIDENTQEDLAHDMQGFRERYPDVEFLDLSVKHPSYKSFSKVFSIPNSHYEYVTFLNPGKKAPFLFSVILNTGSRQAENEELEAYRDVVQSLEYIPQDGVKPPKKAGAGSSKKKGPAEKSGK
jgi:hypothetical protein